MCKKVLYDVLHMDRCCKAMKALQDVLHMDRCCKAPRQLEGKTGCNTFGSSHTRKCGTNDCLVKTNLSYAFWGHLSKATSVYTALMFFKYRDIAFVIEAYGVT